MKRLQKLKTWVCSGEPLVTSLAQQFLDHFHDQDVTLCNFYGSTEVMGDVTFHIIRSSKDLNYDKVPIGEFSVDKFYHIIHKRTPGFQRPILILNKEKEFMIHVFKANIF